MSTLIVTAPLVVLLTKDGSRVHLYDGAPVPDNADPDHVRDLKDGGMVGKASKAEPTGDPGTSTAGSGTKEPTVEEIKAAVGEDKEKAAEALKTEQAGKNRSTLVKHLEGIVNAAPAGD